MPSLTKLIFLSQYKKDLLELKENQVSLTMGSYKHP